MKKQPPIFIIAEAGVNHNGDIRIAKKLIDGAKLAGASAVKFQSFNAKKLASASAPKAKYQTKTTNAGESQLKMLQKLELSPKNQKLLFDYCKKKKIMFLSSPFDEESIEFLHQLNLSIFKIPSGEITNLPYLEKIGSLKKKIILSTGMSTLKEIQNALKILIKAGTPKKNITLLHCTTEYPTPMAEVNLKAMLTLKKQFNIQIGYSDHTKGIEIPIAAAALGASVIEKHFTLDKNLEGPDHKASLEPTELLSMVKAIRNIEVALGNGIKKPSPSEIKNIQIARKSIVAKTKIKKGDLFTEKNLTTKRPGNGLSPMQWNRVIGQKAKKNFLEDEMIKL